MSDISQLLATIESRLAELAAEIAALDAAKTELTTPRTRGQAPVVTTDATAPRSRRRVARRRVTPSRQPPEPATRSRPPGAVAVAQDVGNTVTRKRSRRKRATGTRPRSGGRAVEAETLGRLLADTSVGLSANAIAKQAGAGYGRTLKLLRELEAAGQVCRSGLRRSTVWRLITDEERIAERVAELKRRGGARGQRRGRARAS